MRKIWIIAKREYKAAVMTKAFIIGILLMPLMMGGSILSEVLLKGKTGPKEKKFAVVDRSPGGGLFAVLEAAVEKRNAKLVDKETGALTDSKMVLENVPPSAADPEALLKQRYELSERVKRGDLKGFVDIGADVLKPATPDQAAALELAEAVEKEGLSAASGLGKLYPDASVIRYHTDNAISQDFPRFVETELNRAIIQSRLSGAPLDKLKAAEALRKGQPTPLVRRELLSKDETGAIKDGKEVNLFLAFIIPFGIVMLMFMMIMSGASPLMSSVIEEKMQRIAEVLLSSVTPFQLMMGKLLGGVGVALTLTAVYLGGAAWAAQHYGFAHAVPPALMAWFVFFLALAVLMFGAVFVAIGAACSDMKEAQAMMGPVMVLLCLPLFVMMPVLREPDSVLAQTLSMVPIATPMLLTSRMAILPNMPLWQPLAGAVGVLLATLLFVYVAARIFRVGILMQGKGADLKTMARWIFSG